MNKAQIKERSERRKAYDKKYQARTNAHYQDIVRSVEKMTECTCPRCEIIHELNIYWTGNTLPKKFCKVCQNVIKGMYSGNLSHYEQGADSRMKRFAKAK